VKAVVMAGGQGTRLRPLTTDWPKPMVPVANRPLMEHLIHLLKEHGFNEIIVTTCFLPETFASMLGDGRRFGVSIRYTYEEQPLGTAGGVRQVLGELDGTFLVISGDCLTDFDLSAAVAWHRARRADATLIVTEVTDPTPYGIVACAGDGRVERFLEKPRPEEVFTSTVNAGIYILEPHALAQVPEGVPYDFSRNLFPHLLARGDRLFGYRAEGYWSDIGSCAHYIRAQWDVLSGKVKLPSLSQEKGGIWIDPGARVDPRALLVPPVMVGARAVVAAGARVGPSAVLGPGSRVHPGAHVERSVVWEGVVIERGARVVGAAVGRGAIVSERAHVGEGAAVAHRSLIEAGAVVGGALS